MNPMPAKHLDSPLRRRSAGVGRLTALALSTVLLGACGFAPKAPLGVVDLPLPMPVVPAGSPEPLALQLVVMEPQATALLDSVRIVVRDESGGIAQLAGVALPDRAPRWLQAQLLQALSARPFAAVAEPGAGVKPDLQLIVRIERFELDYRATAQGAISLHVLLLDAERGRALGSARFTDRAAVDGRGSAAGAEALQRAAHAALSALADWTETQARASIPRSSKSEPRANEVRPAAEIPDKP